MIDEGSMHWFRLRSRRSGMPRSGRLAESDDRRLAFAAAMQQFEEQMTAAKVVSPATRPLNLYYALVQAGLAITAAHADGRWRWDGHGLTLTNKAAALEEICVKPNKNDGAFQLVARATDSGLVSRPVSIGAMWASLPDICNVATLPSSTQPRALTLSDETQLGASMTMGVTIGSGLEQSYAIFGPGPSAALLISEGLPAAAERDSWLRELLTHYPTATGWAKPTARDLFDETSARQSRVHLTWPLPGGPSGMTPAEIGAFFDRIAPEYRYQKWRYLRPSLEADGSMPPTPLMTWWLLLYSFSMLARYFPEQWVGMLNLDESPYAVSLQYACEAALTVIPHLVVEALDGEPLLLMMQSGLLW